MARKRRLDIAQRDGASGRRVTSGRSMSDRLLVFAPGYLGFDRLGLGSLGIEYFRGLRARLAARGLKALIVAPSPTGGSVEARARNLAAAIARTAEPRLTLVGHSMGGLDVRHVAHALDPARRVDRVVTLGTPHHGTPVAERMLRENGPVPWLVRAIGRAGLEDLTPEACARRNRMLTDRDDVSYVSLAGARPEAELPLPLKLAIGPALERSGPHDGLVPVASAAWGEVAPPVRADHFELVGWTLPLSPRREPFDHLAVLAELVPLAA
jgi:triacylglycerol lipase